MTDGGQAPSGRQVLSETIVSSETTVVSQRSGETVSKAPSTYYERNKSKSLEKDVLYKFVLENPTYVRVCRDDLRRMRGKYWIPEQEDLITSWEMDSIALGLHHGLNVLVDATNLNILSIFPFRVV